LFAHLTDKDIFI